MDLLVLDALLNRPLASCQLSTDSPKKKGIKPTKMVHMLEHPRSTSARKAVQVIGDAAASGAQSIDRAATLLLVGRAACRAPGSPTSSTNATCSKPTVRRILRRRAGRPSRSGSGHAALSYRPEIYVLGTLAGARFGIQPISLRPLTRLSQETGDTAFLLSVPRDVYSICVHREEGAYPIRIHALHAGDRHPLGVEPGALPCWRPCRTAR